MNRIVLAPATWHILSESNPRWHFVYEVKNIDLQELPSIAAQEIEEKAKILGEPPPDIEIGCLGFMSVGDEIRIVECTVRKKEGV
ncbi:hypothetical protein HY967_04050 [Candidatus Jorgensenbacteria bacterium]|nr:hypothetical protein [Candidatus Jorgensenbacteria bacterium]